jgi:DNA recombination protein RmuC
LDERVRKLQTHFGQANKDIDDILVSTKKLTGRGAKIEALELGGERVGEEGPASPTPATTGRTIHEPRSSPLHLRVVDED